MSSNLFKYLIPAASKGLESGFEQGNKLQEEDKRFQQQNKLEQDRFKQQEDQQKRAQDYGFEKQRQENDYQSQKQRDAEALAEKKYQADLKVKTEEANKQLQIKQEHLNNVISGKITTTTEPTDWKEAFSKVTGVHPDNNPELSALSEDQKKAKAEGLLKTPKQKKQYQDLTTPKTTETPITTKQQLASEMLAAGGTLDQVDKKWSTWGMPSGQERVQPITIENDKDGTFRTGKSIWNPETQKRETHGLGAKRKLQSTNMHGNYFDQAIIQQYMDAGNTIQDIKKTYDKYDLTPQQKDELTAKKQEKEKFIDDFVKKHGSPTLRLYNESVYNTQKKKGGTLSADDYYQGVVNAYLYGFDSKGKHYQFDDGDKQLAVLHLMSTYDWNGASALKKMYGLPTGDIQNDSEDNTDGE